MGFKRLSIAVNCNSEQEQREAQSILDELSNILRLEASDLINNAPMVRKNQNLIRQIFTTISKGGMKSIASIIPLAMQFKK